ncbi:Peroxidase [Hypsibius exemplaris]|uniref:Peroxidase n=1 Tax=Hypsibius exemplaris TaxID=2072580 RepID=A0A1W0WZ17_HYPEX|nr:Peroxidase [Hypsibius exemplaris]
MVIPLINRWTTRLFLYLYTAVLYGAVLALRSANPATEQWRNKPFSQTGSSERGAYDLVTHHMPAQLRVESIHGPTVGHPLPWGYSSRRPVNPLPYGEMSHSRDLEAQAKKSGYGLGVSSVPRFVMENELPSQDGYDDVRQNPGLGISFDGSDGSDQCIVLDLAATLPFTDKAVRKFGALTAATKARRVNAISKTFPYWWQYLHGKPAVVAELTDNQRSRPAHCPRSSPVDVTAMQACRSVNRLRYRTYDGTCNNLHYVQWGSADGQYSRLTKARYDDGYGRPRLYSNVLGYGDRQFPLPNPRIISRSMSQSIPIPHRVANILLPYFGQTIAHDLAFTTSYQIDQQDADCCVENAQCTEAECFQFSIPRNDPLYAFFNLTCHQFARSVPSTSSSCDRTRTAVREQSSKVTHWLDASFLYGNNDQQNEAVRNLFAGQLAFRHTDKGIHNLQNSEVHKQMLPNSAPDSKNSASSPACPHASRKSAGKACFFAADERVNQQPLATAVHTVFLRFHNLVAGSIAQTSPYWSDEMIFQEARKIVVAVYQVVIYKEFLTGLLGSGVASHQLYDAAGLKLLEATHFMGYDAGADPHVLNEFAAAGFRLHTLVDDNVPRLLLVTGLAENSPLSSQYNNQTLLYEEGNADALISGMLEEMALAFDPQISEELQGRLFRGQDPIGLDLMAVTIQRGRDHGLGTYNDVREACGYGRADGFDGLRDFMPPHHVHLLRSLYRDVDDVDLMVGGLMEDALSEDASVGPTFACIVTSEFRMKRIADRFWHENPDQFSPTQLRHLRRATMSHILCQTTGLRYVPSNAFFIVSESNPLVPCTMLTEFDVDFYLSLPGILNAKD